MASFLVVLDSAFAAQTASFEAEAAATLEYKQSIELLAFLVGETDTSGRVYNQNNIKKLLEETYLQSKVKYQKAYLANENIKEQLNKALMEYDRAKAKQNY